MHEFFDNLDSEGTGFINKKQVEETLISFGLCTSMEDVEE
jgi:Ca2+-binding EF-hand superfamily protein